MWWKKNKLKVIIPVLIVAVLGFAFWYGGGAPGMQGWSTEDESEIETELPETDTEEETPAEDPAAPESEEEALPEEAEPEETPEEAAPEETPEEHMQNELPEEQKPAEQPDAAVPSDKDYSEENGMVIDPETGKDKYQTDPVPEGKPLPVEPQETQISDKAYTCTISISCATILNHMDWLTPGKEELVPEDGWILKPMQVTFYEGESVFNVLQRTCKQQKIHMEFTNTPMYNSAYIEGMNNLYERDCGELSGWMYQVNGWFPNYGCSRYQVQAGDEICWEYTCDLGVDVGGSDAVN